VLFVGVATSIAALPMLAAIVGERGLARTAAGVIATAATGLMDVLAWLALVAPLIGTVLCCWRWLRTQPHTRNCILDIA
jgi:Kef-type K+ transport system membrane component KefB